MSDVKRTSDTTGKRLDIAIVSRRLAPSRERAQMLIQAGHVTVDGAVTRKASAIVLDDAIVSITGDALPFVGRGGLKLDAALRQFRINVSACRCLDIGASTGGFTDCLLQRGAREVIAVDVGHGQLHPSLAADPRVRSFEGVNARHIAPDQFCGVFDFVAVDVSFISLTLVLPALVPMIRPTGHLVALIKPEFEAGREAVDERGVVRDPEALRSARDRVTWCAVRELGLIKRALIPSPVRSGRNREYLSWFQRPAEVTAVDPPLHEEV